jgi:hypothetical protein
VGGVKESEATPTPLITMPLHAASYTVLVVVPDGYDGSALLFLTQVRVPVAAALLDLAEEDDVPWVAEDEDLWEDDEAVWAADDDDSCCCCWALEELGGSGSSMLELDSSGGGGGGSTAFGSGHSVGRGFLVAQSCIKLANSPFPVRLSLEFIIVTYSSEYLSGSTSISSPLPQASNMAQMAANAKRMK